MVCLGKRISAAVIGAVLIGPAIFGAPSAVADELVGNVTGGDVSSGPLRQTPEERQQSADKMAVARAWHAATFGGGSAEAYRAAQRAYIQRYGKGADGDSLSTASTTSAPSSASVPISHIGQSKNYYCGPASGMMILKYKGKTTSKYNGASLSQANLATTAHMSTDANGATTWASKRWRIGMNRWMSGSSTGFYVDLQSPTATDVSVALTYDIYHNTIGFGADTVEFAGSHHYNGHPVNQTIGHWIPSYAYANSGGTGYWLDSSTTVWSTVQPRFSYTTSTFTSRFLQTNGITW